MTYQPSSPNKTSLDLLHLRRETRTALELAVVALAPKEVLEPLATSAGLFEALVELPPDSPPVVALVPQLTERTQTALKRWKGWYADHLAKVQV